jgi:hypothetical protein
MGYITKLAAGEIANSIAENSPSNYRNLGVGAGVLAGGYGLYKLLSHKKEAPPPPPPPQGIMSLVGNTIRQITPQDIHAVMNAYQGARDLVSSMDNSERNTPSNYSKPKQPVSASYDNYQSANSAMPSRAYNNQSSAAQQQAVAPSQYNYQNYSDNEDAAEDSSAEVYDDYENEEAEYPYSEEYSMDGYRRS